MRRFTDDERWAAAVSIARGRESPEARRLRRRRQWSLGVATVLSLVTLVLVVTSTPLGDQLIPPRGSSREPYGWQIALGIAAFVVGGVAFLRWRVLNQLANTGNRLPVVDPRTVLRGPHRRAIDRWIRAGEPPPSALQVVTFDRAVRFSTFPLPVWPLLFMPWAFAAATLNYRGPVSYLFTLWAGWAVAVMLTWWWSRRFREAAARYATTRAMVVGPVTDSSPAG